MIQEDESGTRENGGEKRLERPDNFFYEENGGNKPHPEN
jgi:hypothetical protein